MSNKQRMLEVDLTFWKAALSVAGTVTALQGLIPRTGDCDLTGDTGFADGTTGKELEKGQHLGDSGGPALITGVFNSRSCQKSGSERCSVGRAIADLESRRRS